MPIRMATVERERPAAPQQRDSERVEIPGDLQGEVTVFERMAITQISCGGAQIETTFPLQLDSLHDFRLTLDDRSIVVKGRIAHSSISGVGQESVVYRSGVEFIASNERVALVIATFVDALKGLRDAL